MAGPIDKQLVRELRLQGEERGSLEEALDRLSEKGALVELRSGHFAAVGGSREYASGRLSIHRDGFGFLIPEQTSEEFREIFFCLRMKPRKG